MNAQDFIRLNGLLAKLSSVAMRTAQEDGSFRKYNSQSIEALQHFQAHLKNLEHGLKTAKVITMPEAKSYKAEVAPKIEGEAKLGSY